MMRAERRSGSPARRCLTGLVAVGLIVPLARASDGDAVAIVNGRPISKRVMVDALLEAHGLSIMQQLIVLDLAKAETRRLKLTVTEADVQREFDRALARIAPPVDAKGQALTEVEKQQALETLLRERGLTMTEFRIGMERNAHLRKVVERDFQVTEATLREEFARRYGERAEVRHIQVADVNGLHEALNRLNEGEDFAAVARAVSRNADTAPEGGRLPPFAFNDDGLAPALREAAFAMAPGEVSKPIRIGPWWHILKLERRLPPADVCFEDVRAEVERQLRDSAVPQQMNRLITELFRNAEIRVLDRDLRAKYDKLLKDNLLADPGTAP